MAGAFLSDMETLRRRYHADRDVVLPLLNIVAALFVGGLVVDTLALDSEYDYDPVWAKLVELGFEAHFVVGYAVPCLTRAEDEGALDGEPLGGMPGERVGVADVPRLEVAVAQLDGRAAVGGDPERATPEIDPVDGARGAVLDAEDRVVAQADDAVSDGELALCHA